MKKTIMFCFLLGLFTACELAPCITKEAFLSSSKKTYEKFEKGQDQFSDNNWKSMDNTYQKYIENCYPQYETKLTPEEKKEFWLHTSQYFIKRGYKGPEMTEELKELYATHLEKYLESVGDRFADKFKKLMDINVDEAVDKIFDILENLGKE